MAQSTPARRMLRFGVYELDLAACELRKYGARIRLQYQPCQILVLLLERPGEVVTREELRQKLWPDGTFVDFEHSLNAAVKKLREAIGDDADNPRFVETVPRRGYRFIAPVNSLPYGAGLSKQALGTQTPLRQRLGKFVAVAVGYWPAAACLLFALIAVGTVWLIRSRPWERTTTSRNFKALNAVPLTGLPGWKNNPKLSPDGTRVAFGWNGGKGDNFGIYVKQVDTDSDVLLQLTRGVDSRCDFCGDMRLAWSPDGNYIAFFRSDGKTGAIYIVPALGGAERKLSDLGATPGAAPGTSLAWSPDGRQLAISVFSVENLTYHIELLSLDTLQRHMLATVSPRPPFITDTPLAFSPDGKTLFFLRGSTGAAEIFAAPLNGGEAAQITHDGRNYFGAMTSDGQSIVVAKTGVAGSQGLWLVDLRSGQQTQLTGGGERLFWPSVAGHNLMYVSTQTDFSIWHADTHGNQDPIVDSKAVDTDVDLSPDGTRLAFSSARLGTTQIWLCNADGSQPTQITHFQTGHVGTPRWSPDGKNLAFDGRLNDQSEIWVVPTDGGLPKQITNDPADDVVPVWSNDGKWIYFGSNRSGTWEIWKASVSDLHAIQVTHGGGFMGFESPDGKDFYFGRFDPRIMGGAPILKMSLNTGAIESVDPGLSPRWGEWRVRKDGIYAISSKSGKPAVLKYDFATRRLGKVADLPAPQGFGLGLGFAVSPDGKNFFYTRREAHDNKVMIARNWDR